MVVQYIDVLLVSMGHKSSFEEDTSMGNIKSLATATEDKNKRRKLTTESSNGRSRVVYN